MTAPLSAPRPATPREARRVSELLSEAINDTPFYNDTFKASEKGKWSEFFLRRLMTIDPWHVCVIDNGSDVVAVSITMPDIGVLWAPWVYVQPDYRKSPAALSLIRTHLAHWEDNIFHKVTCYVRPDNRAAATINRRLGFKDVALLPQHLFGDDVLLMERPLRKALPGYDEGVAISRGRRLKILAAMYFDRLFRRG